MKNELSPQAGPSRARKGLVIVYTGEGKGKTTAALGLLMRAAGQGMASCVIQFIKSETDRWGEVKSARKLGIEWHQVGDGFTWMSKDLEESAIKARQGWLLAQEKIAGGEYDLVLLDEFTYPLRLGWLDSGPVIEWLRANRPPSVHLIVTGRDAPAEWIDFADLVTEMCLVKHPYEQGVRAQPGIEF